VIYEKFLEMADRKKEVKDEDLELLVGNEMPLAARQSNSSTCR